MITTVETVERKGKVVNYVFNTVVKTAKDMYIYNQKTYLHTEYQTEIASFIDDNDLESHYVPTNPTLKENGEVICSIEIFSMDSEKLEREVKKFREYFNTFLTIK